MSPNVSPDGLSFDDYDINKDGVITREEFEAAVEKKKADDAKRQKHTLTVDVAPFLNWRGGSPPPTSSLAADSRSDMQKKRAEDAELRRTQETMNEVREEIHREVPVVLLILNP